MPIQLEVIADSCIRCNKCVKVCPAAIFRPEAGSGAIGLHQIDHCISCGHCVAVCPTDSVLHSEFPADKVHRVVQENLPTPEQLMNLIRARRSNRAFIRKAIPTEQLDLIIEAAYRAPTASNKQEVKFLLITDPKLLTELSRFTLDTFSKVMRPLDSLLVRPLLKPLMPDIYRYIPAFKAMKSEFERGNDLVMRNATAALIIYAPKSNRFGCEDANLAYQNGSLMAEALGVAHFYMGFVHSATKQAGGSALAKSLGIEGTIHAAMALAMPAFTYPNYVDRKPIDLKRL